MASADTDDMLDALAAVDAMHRADREGLTAVLEACDLPLVTARLAGLVGELLAEYGPPEVLTARMRAALLRDG
jgi:hypothetical protein